MGCTPERVLRGQGEDTVSSLHFSLKLTQSVEVVFSNSTLGCGREGWKEGGEGGEGGIERGRDREREGQREGGIERGSKEGGKEG